MVDTAAFYALADRRDQYHERAVHHYSEVVGSEPLLVTDYILAESWTLIRHRLGRPAAMEFWDRMSSGMIPVLGVAAQDLEQGRLIAHEWTDQDFSLVDCTTMAVMARASVARIFTFDDDFDRYRFGEDRQGRFERVPG